MDNLRYKTAISRFVAAFIDSLLFAPLYFFLEEITDQVLFWEIFTDILWLVYSISFHSRYGQTLGKMVMNIKVVDHQDEKSLIGYKRAAWREVGWIIFIPIDYILRIWIYSEDDYLLTSLLLSCSWTIIELISMLFNKKRRAIHDLIAGSVVIKTTV